VEKGVLKVHLLTKLKEFKPEYFVIDESYTAPESLNTKKYNTASDIWSIGAITYYMLHGKPPFNIYEKHTYPQEYVVDKSLNHFCMDFLSWCLQKNPKNRMNFEEIKSHPFVTRVIKGWELANPNPYSKLKWKGSSECKFNINELTRGIVKAKDEIPVARIHGSTKSLTIQSDKINLSCKSCVEKKGKQEFGTYCKDTYKCNCCGENFNIRKFFLLQLVIFITNSDMIKDQEKFLRDYIGKIQYSPNSKHTHIKDSYDPNEEEELKIGNVRARNVNSSYILSSNIVYNKVDVNKPNNQIHKVTKVPPVSIEQQIRSGQFPLDQLKNLRNLDLSTEIVNGRKYEVK